MKATLFAAAGAVALLSAGAASAQDWSGPYIGAHIGYGKVSDEGNETLLFDTNLDGSYGDTVRTGAGADAFSPGFCSGTPLGNNAGAGCEDDDDSGVDAGLRAGFDWQMGGLVLGVVGEYAGTDVNDSVTGFSTTPASYTSTREIDNVIALRGRVGFPMGDVMPYVTGGYARGQVESTYSTSNTANAFAPLRVEDDVDGWQLGGGVEKQFGGGWRLGLEYIYTNLDAEDHTVRTSQGTAPATNPFLLVNPAGTDQRRSGDDVDLHSLRLTVAYRF